MSSSIIGIPPFRAETPLASKEGKITPDAHRSLLALYNSSPLYTLSTPNGPATFTVPLARLNQNVEITFVKISADANVPILNGQGNDLINGAPFLTMGTAQYSKVKLKSDGVSNWYVVGQ